MAHKKGKADKHRQNPKTTHKILRDNCIPTQKSIKYSTKTINMSRRSFFTTLCNFPTMFSLNWSCQLYDNSTRKQKELIKSAYMNKNKGKTENAYYQNKETIIWKKNRFGHKLITHRILMSASFYWNYARSWEKYDEIVAKFKNPPIFSQNKYIQIHNRH